MRLIVALLSSSILVSSVAFAQAPAPAAPATPVAPAANAPVTRDQIPALVKEALINDPSILTEAIEKVRANKEAESKKQAKEGVATHKNELYSDPNSPVVGAADADVTIVEFFDYHCGYCKQLLPTIAKMLETDKKIRVVFKEFPILSEDSVLASRSALAVNRIAKDKYFAFHTALMAVKGRYDEKTIFDEAKKLGIDTAKLKVEIAKPEIDAILESNRKLGEALAITGTPVTVIGSELNSGALPFDMIQKIVADARAAAKTAKK